MNYGMTKDEHKGPHVRNCKKHDKQSGANTQEFVLSICSCFSFFLNSTSCWNDSKQPIFTLASCSHAACAMCKLSISSNAQYQCWIKHDQTWYLKIVWNPIFVNMILAKQGSKCRSGRPVEKVMEKWIDLWPPSSIFNSSNVKLIRILEF